MAAIDEKGLSCSSFSRVQGLHRHDFGQGEKKKAEQRALLVTVLTLVTMLAEIVAGIVTGSMALLADGIHMGGHAVALGLAAGAYYLARRHAEDRRLSLGSGKIADLAAYTSALFLGITTCWLIIEAIGRLVHPVPLQVFEALSVAILGLAVNLLSVFFLSEKGGHEHHHHHAGELCGHEEHYHGAGQDSNLKAALLHIMADVLTSLAAIGGLLAAALWGWLWLDPVIALVTAVVILRWTAGLVRQTISVLLDREGPRSLRRQVRERIESVADSRITDLHLWSVGQNTWTVMASVVTHVRVSPETYKNRLADLQGIHHPVIEVYHCGLCPQPPDVSPETGSL